MVHSGFKGLWLRIRVLPGLIRKQKYETKCAAINWSNSTPTYLHTLSSLCLTVCHLKLALVYTYLHRQNVERCCHLQVHFKPTYIVHFMLKGAAIYWSISHILTLSSCAERCCHLYIYFKPTYIDHFMLKGAAIYRSISQILTLSTFC